MLGEAPRSDLRDAGEVVEASANTCSQTHRIHGLRRKTGSDDGSGFEGFAPHHKAVQPCMPRRHSVSVASA